MAFPNLAEYPWPSTVNVANFVSVRLSLNRDDLERSINDYKVWKEQMLCLLVSQELQGFIDGQIPPPAPDQIKLWGRSDRLIKGWILGSITGTDVLDAVVELNSSKEVWSQLENIFKAAGPSVNANLNLEYDVTASKSAEYPWPSTVNVANFVSVRLSLNRDDLERSINDYKVWKEQMLCLLVSQELQGFIDGQIPPPLTAPDQLKLWERSDRLIKGWILGAITGTDVLDAVVELNSSKEVWSKLENIFKAAGPYVNANLNLEYDVTGTTLSWPSTLLYRAALIGDTKSGDKILSSFENLISAIINNDKETALHVAVGASCSIDFVRMLLVYRKQPMSNAALRQKNGAGNNALHVAAIVGNTEAAKLLVNKYHDLLYTFGQNKNLPVHFAALYGRKDTLEYLISVSKESVKDTPFEGMLGASLLQNTIASGFVDVALKLVMTYPYIARSRDCDGDHALNVIAGMKYLFPCGESFSWWQNWIYSCLPPKQFDRREQKQKFNWFQKIAFVVPGAKKISRKKEEHQQALEIVKHICKTLVYSSPRECIYGRAILTASHNGIPEVLNEIRKHFPHAMYFKEPETGGYIFHVAARERNENVFNLFNRTNDKIQYFYGSVDHWNNNLMHLCAELAPPHKLNLISGAALQMQRELQWFKEMEKYVNPSHRTSQNKACKTPQMLFTEKHQDLKSQGEKWLKDTATSCTIAAVLIATVMFAAAFTLPGGVRSDSGVPIFVKETPFIIFAISDSVSMFASTTSLLMFLSILTSRFAERDFLYSLPRRLCIGLLTLFTSITFMMIAFTATIYIMLREKSPMFFALVAALACFPVASFVLLQFPLLWDVMCSTYGPSIFRQK